MSKKQEFNILPFLAEAFSVNIKIYNDIDEIYKKNKIEYYNLARKNEFYNHKMSKQGNLLQDEYFKKSLGILLKLVENDDKELYEGTLKLLKHGWSYTYNYIKNREKPVEKELNFEDFFGRYIKKHNGMDNISDDDLNSITFVFIFISKFFGKTIEESKFLSDFLVNCQYRLQHYEGKNRISYNTIEKNDLKLIKQIKLKLSNILELKNFSMDFPENEELMAYLDNLWLLYDLDDLSYQSITSSLKLNNREIEEIIFLYLLLNRDITDISQLTQDTLLDLAEYFIDKSVLRGMNKAYNQVKKYYFENNKETMFVEIESIENELKLVKRDNLLFQDKNENLINQLENKDKEIKRLKEELFKANESKQELTKLREFMFNFDNVEYNQDSKVDYDKLKGLNAVVIGGHQQWQSKMKEYLQNTKFISVDNLNFDTDILINSDIIFIYTNYLSHGLYYKVMECARTNNLRVEYLQSNINDQIVLTQINDIISS